MDAFRAKENQEQLGTLICERTSLVVISILSTGWSIGSQSYNPKERKLGAIKLHKFPGKWQHHLKLYVHNAWRGRGIHDELGDCSSRQAPGASATRSM